MTLRFLGRDPNSNDGDSPTVWEDGDDYLIQGYTVSDLAALTQLAELASANPMPPGENVIRFPKRLMSFFPEVNGAAPTR
ncbi:hypothetical protein ACIBG7_27135 [Nonomuraea sp. NPDC050328]|uniref:hypothetical protein n=1 Tax=Nonomuraea sp. NPDC050328 TaxID=3364361 RepID=UPI00379E138F